MKRVVAVVATLLFFAVPAGAGTERDPKGDTYRIDIKRVILRHQERDGREFWVIRIETYDAFRNEHLRKNSENGMYAVAVRFETTGERPCDRNLKVYVTRRGDEWEPHARITGGSGEDYRKWDGGSKAFGHPRVWRSDERSITIRFRESMLSGKEIRRFGWGLRTVSEGDLPTERSVNMDYAPSYGKLAWEREG